MTTADWIALGSATGTGLAALGTVVAVIYAAKSARASQRTVATMKEQWEADQRWQVQDRQDRLTNLLQSVRSELAVIARVWEQQANLPENALGAPRRLPTWENASVEVAGVYPDVADAINRVALIIDGFGIAHALTLPVLHGALLSFWVLPMYRKKALVAYREGVASNLRESIPAVHNAIAEIDKVLRKACHERMDSIG